MNLELAQKLWNEIMKISITQDEDELEELINDFSHASGYTAYKDDKGKWQFVRSEIR